MNVTEAIRERRSIRKYKPGEEVTKELIRLMLEAAMFAPSACNTRPWEFVVVKDREVLNQIMEVHPYSKMLSTASLAIVVCALPQTQCGISDGYFPQDCGAATQNILLQAMELELGSCWCGIYPNDQLVNKIKALLNVESIPFSLIAIGKADEKPAARGKFEDNKVKWI